jgi:hypothetical protein
VSQVPPPFTGPLPRIRGTQIGLRAPAAVDRIKTDMLAGRFPYHEWRAQIGGYRDARGKYHIQEGHHRMVAALEILAETGNSTPVRELLRWGHWEGVPKAPTISRPMPSRSWWGALRNRWNF